MFFPSTLIFLMSKECVFVGIPPHLHYKPEYMYVVGIIPGPNQPKETELNHYIKLLEDDMETSWTRGVKQVHFPMAIQYAAPSLLQLWTLLLLTTHLSLLDMVHIFTAPFASATTKRLLEGLIIITGSWGTMKNMSTHRGVERCSYLERLHINIWQTQHLLLWILAASILECNPSAGCRSHACPCQGSISCAFQQHLEVDCSWCYYSCPSSTFFFMTINKNDAMPEGMNTKDVNKVVIIHTK